MRPQIPSGVGIQTQPLEIDDFSGGVTDYYLSGPMNKAKEFDNFLIQKQGDKGKPLTRPGSDVYDSVCYQIPAGNQRIGALKLFQSKLLVQSKEKLYYPSAGSGWTTIQGPSSNDLFPSSAATTDITCMAQWNKHLLITSSGFFYPQKLYPNASNVLTLRTAGLPALASSPTCTPGAGAMSFIYAFVYYYTYTVDTLTFEDYGPVTYVTATNAAEPSSSTLAITNIPALSNGTTHNYDTASSNLKVKIYRTTDAGDVFYYVGSVNNGTTSYSDTAANNTISDNGILLYTEGGVPENDPPPLCKLVHVIGDTAYYAHTKEGSEIHGNRLMQAVPGDIDAVPADNYTDDIDGDIVGLSSAKGSPILICENGSVYRVDGKFDQLGRGGMVTQKIADKVDCISSQSVVQTLDGVYWASTTGIFFTDGYQVVRLNEDYDQTWATWIDSATQKSRIQGKYDALKKRIWWTIQDTGETDCNLCYVLDLAWGMRPDSTFTTISGSNDSFSPTALEFNGPLMYRADRRGYLLTHSESEFSDPKIDLNTTPANWQTTIIQYDYTSCAFNFGSNFERKFVPRIGITCQNDTNLSLQIISINDDNPSYSELKAIRYRGDVIWGDPDIIWGDDLEWNNEGLIDEQRRFPAGALRCQYKQIRLTNAYVAIASSDNLGTVDIDSTAKTATLTDAATKDWLNHVVDYYIAFEADGYSKEYLITDRTSDDVITFSDAANQSSTATGQDWVIRGYPINERLNLVSYVVHYAVFGKTQAQYSSSTTGEVGA
jgi:hypothetical protein